ncbi:hypothetical protein Q667_15055 [Marinobacter sp. C1S70]|nr:hypothetical protein Q667_15055 [Marinobacter sp. C1S70]
MDKVLPHGLIILVVTVGLEVVHWFSQEEVKVRPGALELLVVLLNRGLVQFVIAAELVIVECF